MPNSITPTSIALIGAGKIARDQHVPAIAASRDFTLAAAVTLGASLEGVPNFRTLPEMTRALPHVTAVALCTPPQGRSELVAAALALGLDVLNEKPPAATLEEASAYAGLAARAGRVLYQTWHSREAAAALPAKHWLADRKIARVTVTWKEDVRVWHPGQDWMWEPGVGVFDPGINAISLITYILPNPLTLDSATLSFPANKQAPIAASLAFRDTQGLPVAVEFDMDQKGPQTWDIDIESDGGLLKLSLGGTCLTINGEVVAVPNVPEYVLLYRRFAELLAKRQSDVDLTPFRHVTEAFALGKRLTVAPFTWR